MKTLYIDIYFLLNFTIDLVSLHFAALFSGIKTTNKRLLLSSFICAAAACIIVLCPYIALDIIFTIASLVIAIIVCSRKITAKRRISFAISFLIFLSLVGGIVSFAWNLLKEIFSDYIIENDLVNRKMLFFALITLLTIGVFKMLISLMGTGKIKTKVSFEIKFLNSSCSAEALIDTGNLVMDPLGMKPVLIIKRELAKSFLPDRIIDLTNLDDLEKSVKKRIRLIPISKNGSTHVYVGLVPDEVVIYDGDKKHYVDVSVAIDKEGGDFGGFLALMPFSAINNVLN